MKRPPSWGQHCKQQRRATALHRPVGEFGDFEHRVHLEGNPLQLAVFLQGGNELAQVGVGHRGISLSTMIED
jgi:hypothetical protein